MEKLGCVRSWAIRRDCGMGCLKEGSMTTRRIAGLNGRNPQRVSDQVDRGEEQVRPSATCMQMTTVTGT